MLVGGVLAACGVAAASPAPQSLHDVSDQLGWLKTSSWLAFTRPSTTAITGRRASVRTSFPVGRTSSHLASSAPGMRWAGEDEHTALQAIAKGEPW